MKTTTTKPIVPRPRSVFGRLKVSYFGNTWTIELRPKVPNCKLIHPSTEVMLVARANKNGTHIRHQKHAVSVDLLLDEATGQKRLPL